MVLSYKWIVLCAEEELQLLVLVLVLLPAHLHLKITRYNNKNHILYKVHAVQLQRSNIILLTLCLKLLH